MNLILEKKKDRAKNLANLLYDSVRGSKKHFVIGGSILVKNIIQDLHKTVSDIEKDLDSPICYSDEEYLMETKEEILKWTWNIMQLYTECQAEGLIKNVGEGFKPYSYVS